MCLSNSTPTISYRCFKLNLNSFVVALNYLLNFLVLAPNRFLKYLAAGKTDLLEFQANQPIS